jgi:hypothetical protein
MEWIIKEGSINREAVKKEGTMEKKKHMIIVGHWLKDVTYDGASFLKDTIKSKVVFC